MEMIFLLANLLVLLLGIVFFCALFTNAIEWLGHQLNLSEGAIGSILAAVGTAMPETLVPIVAILSGALGLGAVDQAAGHDIGVGAILGAPFMLATLAFFIVGLAVLLFTLTGKRSLSMTLNEDLFLRDIFYFLPAFGFSVAAASIPAELGWLRWVVAFGLLALYAFYVMRTLKLDHPPALVAPVADPQGEATEVPDSQLEAEEGHLDPLWFSPKAVNPAFNRVLLQTFAGLVGIIVMAHFFVEAIHHAAGVFSIPALVLSLIVIPVATELPEKFNSVIWLGKQKDTLALGNITGAMVFQSCIPTAIGILFTPWVLDSLGYASAIFCLTSAIVVALVVRFTQAHVTPWALLLAGGFYAGFLWTALHR